MNLSDILAFDVIHVTDCHAGRGPFNGGEYEIGRTFERLSEDSWRLSYWSSWEGDYCPHRGQYNPCDGCTDDDYSIIGAAELIAVLSSATLTSIGPGRHNPLLTVARFDATGHEYDPHPYTGGCRVCYP